MLSYCDVILYFNIFLFCIHMILVRHLAVSKTEPGRSQRLRSVTNLLVPAIQRQYRNGGNGRLTYNTAQQRKPHKSASNHCNTERAQQTKFGPEIISYNWICVSRFFVSRRSEISEIYSLFFLIMTLKTLLHVYKSVSWTLIIIIDSLWNFSTTERVIEKDLTRRMYAR